MQIGQQLAFVHFVFQPGISNFKWSSGWPPIRALLVDPPALIQYMAPSMRDSWQHVIERWRNEFSRKDCLVPSTVISERSFRTEFQELCRSQKEYYYNALLEKLQFVNISAIARRIDTTFNCVPPSSLAALVFGRCFVSVQVRLECT